MPPNIIFPVIHLYGIYSVSQKKPGQKLNISVTIQYRIIIVSLLGRASSPAQFDILMAVVHQKAIAQESLKCIHHHTITAEPTFPASGC